MDGNETVLKNDSGRDHQFTFDNSFWSIDADNPLAPYATQEDVYSMVAKPLLKYSFEGYNTCLFAYGQVCSVTFLFCLHESIDSLVCALLEHEKRI